MHHFPVAMKSGFAVAYRRPNGDLCAVADCPTRETAQAKANELNAEAERAQAAASSFTTHRTHGWVPPAERRPVRWFPDDAFA